MSLNLLTQCMLYSKHIFQGQIKPRKGKFKQNNTRISAGGTPRTTPTTRTTASSARGRSKDNNNDNNNVKDNKSDNNYNDNNTSKDSGFI